MKIRETSIEFGRINKRQVVQKQDDIEKTMKILEEQTANIDATDCQNVWSELEKKRRELETIIEYQTKGAILRSKSRWYNEGEKNTKYFLNLEKRHCKQGTITQLKVNDKDLIQSDREILHECETFYKNLYSSKVQVNDYPEVFFPPTREVLSEESKQHCEGLLSVKECLEASNGMAKEKTPGTDGLPCEFYKAFWKDIGETLTEALNFSYQTRKLAVSERRGIVKRIPKKDADPNLIKNWRPLTLLNCDYKIASKVIANRIKMVLPELISEDQSRFIKKKKADVSVCTVALCNNCRTL